MTDFLKQVPSIVDPGEMASKVFSAETETSRTDVKYKVRHLRVLDENCGEGKGTIVCQCDATARTVDGCLRDMSEFTPDGLDEAVLAAGRENCAKGRKQELLAVVSKVMPTQPVISVDPQDETAIKALYAVLDTPLDGYCDFATGVLPDIQGGIESWTWGQVFTQVPAAREKLFGRAWPFLKTAAKKVGLDATLDIPMNLLQGYLSAGRKK